MFLFSLGIFFLASLLVCHNSLLRYPYDSWGIDKISSFDSVTINLCPCRCGTARLLLEGSSFLEQVSNIIENLHKCSEPQTSLYVPFILKWQEIISRWNFWDENGCWNSGGGWKGPTPSVPVLPGFQARTMMSRDHWVGDKCLAFLGSIV